MSFGPSCYTDGKVGGSTQREYQQRHTMREGKVVPAAQLATKSLPAASATAWWPGKTAQSQTWPGRHATHQWAAGMPEHSSAGARRAYEPLDGCTATSSHARCGSTCPGCPASDSHACASEHKTPPATPYLPQLLRASWHASLGGVAVCWRRPSTLVHIETSVTLFQVLQARSKP